LLADPSVFMITSAAYDVRQQVWVQIAQRGGEGLFGLGVVEEG